MQVMDWLTRGEHGPINMADLLTKLWLGLHTKLLGKTSLTSLNFYGFYKYPSIFKTSHLGVSNFGFLSLYPFRTENVNFIPDSKTTPFPKRHSFSFGVRGKISNPLEFSI